MNVILSQIIDFSSQHLYCVAFSNGTKKMSVSYSSANSVTFIHIKEIVLDTPAPIMIYVIFRTWIALLHEQTT